MNVDSRIKCLKTLFNDFLMYVLCSPTIKGIIERRCKILVSFIKITSAYHCETETVYIANVQTKTSIAVS